MNGVTKSNLRHIPDALLRRVSHGSKLWLHCSVRVKPPRSFFLQNLFYPRNSSIFHEELSFRLIPSGHSLEQAFWNISNEHRFSFGRFLSQLLKCPEQPVSPVCLTWPGMSESIQIHTWTPMTYVLRNSFYPSVNWKEKHYVRIICHGKNCYLFTHTEV